MNVAWIERQKEIEDKGCKGRGQSEIKRYLGGEVLSATQAIKAKCYDCMGYYADGNVDCETPTCPLYGYMPYGKGGARKKRVLTDDQRAAIGARFKLAREKTSAQVD